MAARAVLMAAPVLTAAAEYSTCQIAPVTGLEQLLKAQLRPVPLVVHVEQIQGVLLLRGMDGYHLITRSR
jgi:hypothetical protein